jgi:uroporphyrinogen III methyltransferase/synthase
MTGTVYLVGAGPGDYRLLTLKGKDLLGMADVVVYDHLADERILAFAPADAEFIYVGKEASKHTMKQYEINACLVEKAKSGKTVVRLKGGDPFVFGRGGEEAEVLFNEHVPFEVVPGITSAISVPAYAGIPVTNRGVAASFAVITGHEDPTKEKSSLNWPHLATGVDTLVFLMGVHNLAFITGQLIKYGRSGDTPAALIRWGTKAEQETLVTTVAKAAEDVKRTGLKPPAIFIVGDVVKLRSTLRWFDNKPLFGTKILITRTRSQASSLSKLLESYGADCVELPTIKIVPPADKYAALDHEVEKLSTYQWLIFTSTNGVDAFFSRLALKKLDARALGNVKVAVIGPATAARLKTYGIQADVIPERFVAESLAAKLVPEMAKTTKVLLVRAQTAREVLPEALKAHGANVTIVLAYQTVPAVENKAKLVDLLTAKKIDMITFTSSSTVQNLVQLLDNKTELLQDTALACIGPITAATCEKSGLKPTLVATKFTIPALAEIIKEWKSKKNEN